MLHLELIVFDGITDMVLKLELAESLRLGLESVKFLKVKLVQEKPISVCLEL